MLHFSAHWRGEDCRVPNLLELRGTERGGGGDELAIVECPRVGLLLETAGPEWNRRTDPLEHRQI